MMKTNLPLYWHCQFPHRQEGAVLVVSLMLLVILTMLGISAIESTKLETRMAKNTKAYNEAFQMAEAGLAQVGNQLMNMVAASSNKTDETQTTGETETNEVFIPYDCFLGITSLLQLGDEGETKEATLGIMSSKAQAPGGGYLFFVTQSTGYNGMENDKNVINVTLEGGMKREVPKSDNLGTAIIEGEDAPTVAVANPCQ